MGNSRRAGGRALSAPAVISLALLALAGCAGNDGGSGTTGSGQPPAASAPSVPAGGTPAGPAGTPAGPAEGAEADLSVTLTSDGTTVTHRYRLACDGGEPAAGTTHPRAKDACAFLDGDGKALLVGSPGTGATCTQQFLGPQTAVVQGTLNGAHVQRAFSLTDGCRISVWKSAEVLLGAGTSGGAQ